MGSDNQFALLIHRNRMVRVNFIKGDSLMIINDDEKHKGKSVKLVIMSVTPSKTHLSDWSIISFIVKT